LFETIAPKRAARTPTSLGNRKRRWTGLRVALACSLLVVAAPSRVLATHEADHRFTVEGFVCGADGNGLPDADVLVKDTKISYGQVVKTDGGGYYKATFHLHNDNLGDSLLVEAKGEQQNHKIQFDPKDLESERKIQVNFGSGCIHDRKSALTWIWWGLGGVAAVAVGVVGLKMVRAQRKKQQKRGKSQGKRRQ
jgi:hypothetical protein